MGSGENVVINSHVVAIHFDLRVRSALAYWAAPFMHPIFHIFEKAADVGREVDHMGRFEAIEESHCLRSIPNTQRSPDIGRSAVPYRRSPSLEPAKSHSAERPSSGSSGASVITCRGEIDVTSDMHEGIHLFDSHPN